jgi:hypothetical protein
MPDDIDIHHQASFGEDGEIVVQGTTETSLDQFGIDLDHRDPDSRVDKPEATEFGIDDRPQIKQASQEGTQVPLVASIHEEQETLCGEDPPAPFDADSPDATEF